MKKVLLLSFVILLGTGFSLQAQKIHVPIKKKATEKTNEEIDKSIDKGLNKLFGKKKKKTNSAKPQTTQQQEAKPAENQSQTAGQPATADKQELKWAKYDFVPGDKVIFEDNLTGEENGEFPSRWDLVRGNVEIAQVNGENVIMFREGEPTIIPYFKDPQADYLPDVFTVEFDLYYPGSGTFEIFLYDKKNQKSGSPTGYTSLGIQSDNMEFGTSSSNYPSKNLRKARWMHIAIAYTKGKLKAYMNDTRLINLPRIDFDPKGITLYTYHARNDNRYFVKNLRIAQGGVKYYDRFIQDGKIIASGLRFETGKAEILPESMGIINKIYNLMNEHPEVRMSVEGHTDNVGDDAMNQTLSEKRAEAVKTKLVSMGIDASRLVSKGWGETKPVDT
ncbi:MAG: OmpA family protein, partial [Bacteroidales bacterium]|nr:OmpA family protein [Bacteroidales bacterium]